MRHSSDLGWAGLTGWSRTALSAAVAIVVAAPALAQNTTAAIGGVVTDGSGRPVAGASVAVTHTESGSVSTTVTDANGRYAARGLRVGGPYTIVISSGGQRQQRDGVFLGLAETLAFDASLGVSTVVVTGQALGATFNRSAMGSGTNISSAQLNSLASIQRNLQDYARTDPRLAQTDKERGEISAAGQNTRYNSITIDGVTTNDTFGLESNNLPTAKQPISIDAIQSVQVNLSNYDVTQKGYTGANINAVTKSGTNDWKGTLSYIWRDDGLVGQRYNRTDGSYSDAPKFKEDTKAFTIGGPLIKDKLFLFAAYEDFSSSRTSPDYGPIGSTMTNVGITSSAITEAIDIAKNTWGMDVGDASVPGGVSLKVKDTLLKLDWNINDNHRANLRYTKTEQTEPFLVGFSSTGLSLSSYWYNQNKTVESLVGQWFADWTPNFSTEFKLSSRDYDSQPVPVNGARLPQVTLRFSGNLPAGVTNVATGNRDLVMGTERSRHFNVLQTKTTDAYFSGNLNLGAHELKFGVDYANNEVYNAFLQDTNGQYRFQCENGSYSFGTVNCATATAAVVQAAVMENFRLGLPSFYQVQSARAGLTLNDGVATWSYGNTGLFLQDSWRITPKFSVTLGLRMDQQNVPDKPLYNAAAETTFGYNNTTTLDGNTLWQPRLGFNWDLSGERRTQLRGGVGLFQGAAASVWLSNPFSNTGLATSVLSCTNYTNCRNAGATFSGNPDSQPGLTGSPPAANVDFLSTGLQQPSVWKANLALDAELPALPVVGKLVAGAEWLHTETKTGIFYQHLNLGNATATGSDGRQLFYNTQGRNSACWNANGSSITSGVTCAGFSNKALRNTAYNNVMLARETSMGSGDAVTLSLNRPLSAGFGWGVAYTRTTATEVSPLTSSTSSSNWSNRNIFNPNEEVLQNSNYLIKDRFSGNLTFQRAFVSSYKTTFGVTFESRKGKPYSWTYINDLNGDGISGNDLMYIPSASGSGEVVFKGGAAEEAKFWDIVNANAALAGAKGGVVGRNNSYAPWVNTFDLRVSQELPGFTKKHKASFTLDILNLGNLLNKKWGRIDEINFPSNRSFVNYAGLDANGKYVYSLGSTEDLSTKQASGESQWAIQATLRYEF